MDKRKEIEETKELARDLYEVIDQDWGGVYYFETAENLIKKGYRKVPEGAVILTKEELEEKIDCVDVAMIHHADDGKRYIEYEKYDEFTDRLGDRIRQLKGQLKRAEDKKATEILQGFMCWLKGAITHSYNKSVNGSKHYGGMNCAFHEMKDHVKKIAESEGVVLEMK